MSTTINVRPIRTDADLKAALARIEEIFHADAGTPEGDEAEVLTVLIQAYERERWPARPIEPVEALRFHMERLGLRQADLIPYMGASSRVSEVMGGKRKLTVEMIGKLSKGLGIPVEDLVS